MCRILRLLAWQKKIERWGLVEIHRILAALANNCTLEHFALSGAMKSLTDDQITSMVATVSRNMSLLVFESNNVSATSFQCLVAASF